MKHMHWLTIAVFAVAFLTAGDAAPTETETESPEQEICEGTEGSKTLVGFGYSSDSQQFATQRCYNASIAYICDKREVIQLSTAVSYSNLELALGVSLSGRVGYFMFSSEPEPNYLRSIKDTDYSYSLNFYRYVSNKVIMEIENEPLTDFGKRMYKDGSNPLFGLVCGDEYVVSYRQGALFIMGLNLKFKNVIDKNNFIANAGFSLSGSIVTALENIKKVTEEHTISGSVEIHVFQIGGEQNKLSDMLKKDSDENYGALTCSYSSVDDCIKMAGCLLDYATVDFPNQMSAENNKGLTPFGISFTKTYPIHRIGLKVPSSLVTKEIEQYRNDLAKKLKENQYYQEKLHPLVNNGYPVKLDDVFLNNLKTSYCKAKSNIGILLQSHGGAVDCYNFSENCTQIKSKIFSQLQNFTKDDFKAVENLKYTIDVGNSGTIYNTGGVSVKSWRSVVDGIDVQSMELSDDKCSYEVHFGRVENKKVFSNAKGRRMEFRGQLLVTHVHSNDRLDNNYLQVVSISPFYFGPYSTSTCV